jgi:hypothetical protein
MEALTLPGAGKAGGWRLQTGSCSIRQVRAVQCVRRKTSFSVIRLDRVKERRRRSVELKGLDS